MNLRDLRTARKMSLSEVAEQLFVTKQAVSHFECGRARLPEDRVDELAEIYGVSPEEVKAAAFDSWVERRKSNDRLYTALSRARSMAHMTREEATKKLGIGMTTLFRWEKYPTKVRVDNLIKLAELYKRDPVALMQEVVDESDG